MVINILGSGYPTKSRNNQQSWLREQDLHYSTYESCDNKLVYNIIA